jgi:hypothetical protein
VAEATTIPAGITAQGHNCWELIDPSTNLPVDDHSDGIRHFDSRADAQERADDTDLTDLAPREMAAPCWTVTALCGWRLDEELPMIMHHVDAGEALRAALDSDMRLAGAGLACSPDCDDCAEADRG